VQISASSGDAIGDQIQPPSGRLPMPPLLVAGLLTLASLGLLLLARRGLPGFAPFEERLDWIAGHRLQWAAAWALVALSMAGLVAMQVWWAGRLRWREGTLPLLVAAGAALCTDALGLLYLVTASPAEAAALRSTGTTLTVGVATPLNALVLLGLVLVDARRPRGALATVLGLTGAALASAACLLLEFEWGLVVTIGVVFGLVPVVCLLVAHRFRTSTVPGSSNAYRMCSTWEVSATREELCAIFEAPETLEQWWGRAFLRSAQPAGSERVELHTRGWLPYTLRLDAEVTCEDLPRRFVVDTSGDLVGRCVCWLEELDGRVRVHFDWVVRAEKPIVRNLSWLLKPLFVSNHRWVMSQGRRGLEDELARLRSCVRRESA
jgi:hypothetical protein